MLNPNSGETELVFEFGQYIKQTEITILAPLYQQAFRWFREKYDLFISIFHYENGYALNNLRRFDTHEEAEVALLTSLIELAESMV